MPMMVEFPGGNHPKRRKRAGSGRFRPGAKSAGASSSSRPTGRPTTLETLPSTLDQGRPQGLDRVAAGAPSPLPESHIAFLLRLGEPLEGHRGPFEPLALLSGLRARPVRSAPRARAPTAVEIVPRLGLVGGLAERLAVEHDVGVASDHDRLLASLDGPRLRRAFSSTSCSGSPPLSSSTRAPRPRSRRRACERISLRCGDPEASTHPHEDGSAKAAFSPARGTRSRSRARPTRRSPSRGPC